MNDFFEDSLDHLDEVIEFVDYSVVGPTDGRRRARNTSRYPYVSICHLSKDYGDGNWIGNCTGALIAPRLVMTAAHCLYSHGRKRRKQRPVAQRVRVAPGRSGRFGFPNGAQSSSRFYAARRFITDTNRSAHDYGVIVLPQSFAIPRRHMRMRAASARDLNRLKRCDHLTIAGYPRDKSPGEMWEHLERLRNFTASRLLYTVDTCPGQSGSPIWYRRGGLLPTIIGIHTTGIIGANGESFRCKPGEGFAPPGSRNSGVRLTARIMRDVTSPATSARMKRLP